MAKDIKAFCGYCEFAENCEKHFFECDKHEVFAEIAKDQHKIDTEKAEQFCMKWLEEMIELWLPDLRDEPFHTKAVNEVKERLHKAMEEEQ